MVFGGFSMSVRELGGGQLKSLGPINLSCLLLKNRPSLMHLFFSTSF